MDDKEFLNWLRDRMVNVYHESENVDFVQKLAAIADRTPVGKYTSWVSGGRVHADGIEIEPQGEEIKVEFQQWNDVEIRSSEGGGFDTAHTCEACGALVSSTYWDRHVAFHATV